jgi:ubiquinone/menaquinone biosynthesis C-methylase UbiE
MTLDERLAAAPQLNGVRYLSDPAPHAEGEARYLRAREKEGRLYADATTRLLPNIDAAHPLAREWAVRRASALRLTHHLSGRPAGTLIDLGCGNGWLSNQLARLPGCAVYGVDVNRRELEQGARVFAATPRLRFVYADVLAGALPERCADIVIVASAVQYFPNLAKLLRGLLGLLNDGGEIHILDSPLYSTNEVGAAQARTQAYYARLGFPEMAPDYHHHTMDALAPFNPVWLYNPRDWGARLRRWLGETASPFPWVMVRR